MERKISTINSLVLSHIHPPTQDITIPIRTAAILSHFIKSYSLISLRLTAGDAGNMSSRSLSASVDIVDSSILLQHFKFWVGITQVVYTCI